MRSFTSRGEGLMVAVWGKRRPGELPVRALLRASPGPNHQQLVIAAEAHQSGMRVRAREKWMKVWAKRRNPQQTVEEFCLMSCTVQAVARWDSALVITESLYKDRPPILSLMGGNKLFSSRLPRGKNSWLAILATASFFERIWGLLCFCGKSIAVSAWIFCQHVY